MKCWCGNENLLPWGAGYLHCDICQTLVADNPAAHVDTRVKDESADLYGRDYWFAHQTADLDCPDIVTRSRTDLAERAIHWMRSVLRFVLPPAEVLEIGCAHGGFVAMLNQAGFNAKGLELSPAIVQFAHGTFGVEVLTGPIEDQSIPAGSLDLIVMMDVMEHLPNPLQTLGKCLDLLKPGGILLIQTPAYPERKSLADLKSTGHKFPMMLDPREHPFLFSRTAACDIFLGRLGTDHIRFIPAIFDFYDMSFVVSKSAIIETTPEDRASALAASVPSRMIQALLDLDGRRLNLLEKYRQLTADRAASI
jgi:2-polyprenyl-3-methyl-5-hydroxy-6-metoxy-1,4-benzoquinol methylase